MKAALVIILILAASIASAYYVLKSSVLKEARMSPDTSGNFELNSSVFAENGDIPVKYTCKGDNVSPPLEIANVPAGTESLALILHDPDAPGGDWLHWTVWNIDPATGSIAENAVPAGAIQGKTSFGTAKYGGPCPPSGTHHYEFDLYALGARLNLPAGATRTQLERAMAGQIVGQTKLIGLFAAT